MTELTIDQALQQAIEAHKSGQVQKADRLYTAILKTQPTHPDANHNMGVLAVGVGKVEQALPFFKTALEANPATAQFWISYVDALIKLGKLADAKAVFDQAKSKGAKGDGFDKLEQRLNETGEEPVVESELAAAEPRPKQPNILDTLKLDQAIKLANKKAKEGDTGEAKSIYQDILVRFPKNKRAMDGRKGLASKSVGKIFKAQEPSQDQLQAVVNFYNQGQLQQALEQAGSLIESFPQSAVLFNIQGAALQSLGQLEQSILAYCRALAIKPDYAEPYYNMGTARREQGKLEEAIEAYRKALAIEPDYAEAYYNVGNALKELGKLEDAIEAYTKALAIKPDNADANNNMGNALKELGKLEDAIEAYTKALAVKPDHAEATQNLSNLSIQLFPIIANNGCGSNKRQTQIHSEVVLRPKYLIHQAIRAYLEADFSRAQSYHNDFQACDPNLLNTLKPLDKQFCNGYGNFIGKLLENTLDEASDTKNNIYHLGESHCLSYAHRNITVDLSSFRISPRITFGAKAFHFSRPKRDSFKAITKAHLVSLPRSSKVFLSYGEIDCRSNDGFIPAARKLNKPLKDIINQTTEGYVQWFLQQNQDLRHRLYFINVPAPVYDKKQSSELNLEVARTVKHFNSALKKYTGEHGLDIVDVFKFTAGKEEFSNRLFHIDNFHLGAKAITEIEQQLS